MLEENTTKTGKAFMVIAIFGVALCYLFFSVAIRRIWDSQYRNGIYNQPFCGDLDESGLTLLGEIDGCDVYMYNMNDLSYITYKGNRKPMEQVLEEQKENRKEDIFPIDGENEIEIIDGRPVRVNRYEALVTVDLGGALIFTHCTQNIEDAYRELEGKYN
ncbi:MAG: hypothetical protein K6A61_07800 [Butyrivibrio sp.]|nr:hypothetical protein [Butyrivibrio sp.]